MQRNFAELEERVFDVLVIGGGIFGACAAWDAALRGLSVALVEQSDFAAGTSANSYKFVHGGIRYLQHGDVARLRQSCKERTAFLTVAPHLVSPIPVVVPTYDEKRRGKGFLGAGMLVYDALTFDRNFGIRDRDRRIPLTRFLAKQEVESLFPGLRADGLTGATVFADGQMYNPTRLVLAFVRSAIDLGTVVVNYAEAEKLVLSDGSSSIEAVRVRDRVTGDAAEVRARTVLNATGPWTPTLLESIDDRKQLRSIPYSRDACFVVKRRFDHGYAVAVQGRTRDPDALLARGARHVFLTPWRNYTLCGVWHRVWPGHPDTVRVQDNEIESFISEVNEAMPGLDISPSELTMWNAGLVPFGDNAAQSEDLRYGKRSHLLDHSDLHGIDNLVSLIGIRYTMARADAARAVDLIDRKLGGERRRSPTDRTPVHGGAFERFDSLVRAIGRASAGTLGSDAAEALAHNHGSEYRHVLRLRAEAGDGCIGTTTTLRAEVLHAVREEMALTLADIVFRRTDLATGGHPGPAALQEAASLAARELGWDEARRREEVAAVENRFVIGRPIGVGSPDLSTDRTPAMVGMRG